MKPEPKKTPPEPTGKKKLNRLTRKQLIALNHHLFENGQYDSARAAQVRDLLN